MGKKKATQMIFFVIFMIWASFIGANEATSLKYKNPRLPVNARVKDLLSQMTLDEKIGQMVQIERQVASADVMKNYFIGIIYLLFFILSFIFLFYIFFWQFYYNMYILNYILKLVYLSLDCSYKVWIFKLK